MSVGIFNTFDENALPLSNITLRRAKYIDQSRAEGISAITGLSELKLVQNKLIRELAIYA